MAPAAPHIPTKRLAAEGAKSPADGSPHLHELLSLWKRMLDTRSQLLALQEEKRSQAEAALREVRQAEIALAYRLLLEDHPAPESRHPVAQQTVSYSVIDGSESRAEDRGRHGGREGKDAKEARELRDLREARDSRDSRDFRDWRDWRDSGYGATRTARSQESAFTAYDLLMNLRFNLSSGVLGNSDCSPVAPAFLVPHLSCSGDEYIAEGFAPQMWMYELLFGRGMRSPELPEVTTPSAWRQARWIDQSIRFGIPKNELDLVLATEGRLGVPRRSSRRQVGNSGSDRDAVEAKSTFMPLQARLTNLFPDRPTPFPSKQKLAGALTHPLPRSRLVSQAKSVRARSPGLRMLRLLRSRRQPDAEWAMAGQGTSRSIIVPSPDGPLSFSPSPDVCRVRRPSGYSLDILASGQVGFAMPRSRTLYDYREGIHGPTILREAINTDLRTCASAFDAYLIKSRSPVRLKALLGCLLVPSIELCTPVYEKMLLAAKSYRCYPNQSEGLAVPEAPIADHVLLAYMRSAGLSRAGRKGAPPRPGRKIQFAPASVVPDESGEAPGRLGIDIENDIQHAAELSDTWSDVSEGNSVSHHHDGMPSPGAGGGSGYGNYATTVTVQQSGRDRASSSARGHNRSPSSSSNSSGSEASEAKRLRGRKRTSHRAARQGDQSAQAAPSEAATDKKYCICEGIEANDYMVQCENSKCNFATEGWFHVDCLGIQCGTLTDTMNALENIHFFCPGCHVFERGGVLATWGEDFPMAKEPRHRMLNAVVKKWREAHRLDLLTRQLVQPDELRQQLEREQRAWEEQDEEGDEEEQWWWVLL